MILENTFSVPTSMDKAWRLLLDLDRVAPCMPGATLDSTEGDEFSGRIRLKIGAIQLTYRMKGRFTEKDEDARRIVIEGAGKEHRGAGTASAVITVTMEERGSSTEVKVSTDLNITGKPAQFGRGALEDIGGKILGQFAHNLSASLATDGEPVTVEHGKLSSAPRPGLTDRQRPEESEPLDLMGVLAPSPDRIIAVAISVTAVVLALLLWRAIRSH